MQRAGTSWAALPALSNLTFHLPFDLPSQETFLRLLLLLLNSAQAGEAKLHCSALFLPGGGPHTSTAGGARATCALRDGGDSKDAQDV